MRSTTTTSATSITRAMAPGLFCLFALATACDGQKLVAEDGSTGEFVAKASAGDVPPTTGTTHGTTGTTSATSSTSSTSGGHTSSSTSGTTTHGATTGTTTTTTTSSTTGCAGPYDLASANSWTIQSQYNLQQAGLPTFNAVVSDISTALNTINTLGLVAIPTQILQIFDVLASLDVFFQQLNVTSTVTFTATGTPGVYDVAETWTSVISTDCSGNMVDLSGGQITAAEVNSYTATVCDGTITFSQHSIGTNLEGLITPILDGAVALISGGTYMTFSDLISYVFCSICSSINVFTNPTGYAECVGLLSTSLQQEIYGVVNGIGVDLANATITSGTGTVESGTLIDMGTWDGTDGAGTFNGTFTLNGS